MLHRKRSRNRLLRSQNRKRRNLLRPKSQQRLRKIPNLPNLLHPNRGPRLRHRKRWRQLRRLKNQQRKNLPRRMPNQHQNLLQSQLHRSQVRPNPVRSRARSLLHPGRATIRSSRKKRLQRLAPLRAVAVHDPETIPLLRSKECVKISAAVDHVRHQAVARQSLAHARVHQNLVANQHRHLVAQDHVHHRR